MADIATAKANARGNVSTAKLKAKTKPFKVKMLLPVRYLSLLEKQMQGFGDMVKLTVGDNLTGNVLKNHILEAYPNRAADWIRPPITEGIVTIHMAIDFRIHAAHPIWNLTHNWRAFSSSFGSQDVAALTRWSLIAFNSELPLLLADCAARRGGWLWAMPQVPSP